MASIAFVAHLNVEGKSLFYLCLILESERKNASGFSIALVALSLFPSFEAFSPK
jgi:hypothetical protein